MIVLIRGLSNSGKTTLADKLAKLIGTQRIVWHLDGDVVRNMTYNLNYSLDGRDRNVEKGALLANLLNTEYSVIICSFVAPKQEHAIRFVGAGRAASLEIYCVSARAKKYANDTSEMDPPSVNAMVIGTDSIGMRYDMAVRFILRYILLHTIEVPQSENGGGI